MFHTVELTLGRSFSTGLPSTYAHRNGVLPFIASTTKSPTTTTTAGRMQAEKHRSALPTGPIQASGALPGHGIAQHQPRLGSLRRRAVPDARLELSSRWLG